MSLWKEPLKGLSRQGGNRDWNVDVCPASVVFGDICRHAISVGNKRWDKDECRWAAAEARRCTIKSTTKDAAGLDSRPVLTRDCDVREPSR